MEKRKVILDGASFAEFSDLLTEVVTGVVRRELKGLTTDNKQIPIEYGTRGQVSKKLQISLSTLHSYTKNGILQGCRIGGKVLYKWDEVEKAVKDMQSIKFQRRTSKK